MSARPIERAGGAVAHADAHALAARRVAAGLRVDPARGLSQAEASRRLAEGGRNELEARRAPSPLALLADSVTEPFVLLLIVAGIAAVALGEVRDGLLVLVGLLPIVGADVITEYRGERALEELRAAAAAVARVRREGSLHDVPAADLVPGDVVLLEVGDVAPADLRVAVSSGMLMDRSVLTGESLPEPASVAPDPADATLADRRAIAYSGTSVVRGRGEGIVVATGPRTELGRIAGSLRDRGTRRSPLQAELDRLVRILVVVAVSLVAITMGLGFLRGQPAGANVLAGISAAIAAIPEEPPVMLAVILGLGAYRLLRRGVLVRRLNAQETLGAVDLILTDKTGTLTENRLRLDRLLTPDGPIEATSDRLSVAVDALRAESDPWSVSAGARPSSFSRALGSAIDELGARVELAPDDLLEAEPVEDGRPYARTRARREGTVEDLALGAPEAVLDLLGSDDDAASAEAWRDLVEQHADEGARLLLLARRVGSGPWEPRALLGFADRLRDGVADALAQAREAGIQTVMVTGDHPRTAASIARAAGLPSSRVITGRELDRWDDGRLRRELRDVDIVARAIPEQKLRLVEAARETARTIAVTGDGVNDAPALHRADVAVAMGSGTAVAREASDLVLGDDSFATLMHGLAEGRRIIANVQKGLVFLLSTHVALLGFILVATLVGYGQPLLPIQILWLELFIDTTTSVAFEREPAEPDAMHRPPRPRGLPLLTGALLARVALAGGWTVGGALVLLATHDGGFEHARWLAFTALVVGQLVRAYANRSVDLPVTRLRPNALLATACLLALVVQVTIPYVPALADAFRATPLDGTDWALIAVVALVPAVAADVLRRVGLRPWVA